MRSRWLIALLIIVAFFVVCISFLLPQDRPISPGTEQIPIYSGDPHIVIGDNVPDFTEKEKDVEAYEFYSELDQYNRCGYAMACIGIELMPTEERGSIGQVKPSGWQTVKYDFIDGKYLYNRCHLIGYQLTGENSNPYNLITGTRYLNMKGMLPFEDMVADYIKETGNHVLYRVTPDFRGTEMLARGVRIEGWSVEDGGAGICFDVYAYNVQPGVAIDYETGESKDADVQLETQIITIVYVLNISSKRFHTEDCGQGENIKEANKEVYSGSREELLELGFIPAACCDP